MEDDLILFLKKKPDINILLNGRRPICSPSNGRRSQFFLQMEDNLNFFLQMEDDLNFSSSNERRPQFLSTGRQPQNKNNATKNN